jgi:hypothetical protein
MSFTIIDMGSEAYELSVNVWTWKPTLEVIRSLNYVDERVLNQMANSGMGTKMSQDDANMVGKKIEEKFLPKLQPNKRILLDLTITEKPDDGTFHSDSDEKWKNYSASYDWLEEFSAFCSRCKGFQVY